MSRVEDLYARFESRFRGTRQEILARLQSYGPLIELLEARTDNRVAVDCGCGRGEWLELIGKRGWSAHGVDMSEAMLAEAAEHDLTTVHGDAIEYLKTLADGSLALITAFHLVEHLRAEVLLTFLTECARVCATDGVVIFETPNPENLRVGTSTFHLDPTHDKPLPPQLLQFYVEECGLGHAQVIRLNGTPEPQVITSLEGAMRPLFEGGLDYAVIATKSGDDQFVQALRDYVKATTQPIPTSLDGARAYDLAHQTTRAGQTPETHGAEGTRGEAQQGSHSASEAVHNTALLLAEHLHQSRLREQVARDADERTANEQIGLLRHLTEEYSRAQATSQQMQEALHSAVVAVHNAVEPLAGRVEALEHRLESAFDVDRRAENDRLHAVQQVVDQWPEVQRTVIGMHGAVHSAVVAVHNAIGLLAGQLNEVSHVVAVSIERERQATVEQRAAIDQIASGLDARFEAQRTLLEKLESKTVASMQATLDNALVASRAEAQSSALDQAAAWTRVEVAVDRLAGVQRDVVTAEAAVRQQMSEAAERQLDDVKDQFRRSTSWRVTAPLRALSRAMRPKLATDSVPPTAEPVPGNPAARRLVYQPFIWEAGRATFRRLPRLRQGLLQIIEQRGLQAHPLAAPAVAAPIVDAGPAIDDGHENTPPDSPDAMPYSADVQRLHTLFVTAQEQQDVQR